MVDKYEVIMSLRKMRCEIDKTIFRTKLFDELVEMFFPMLFEEYIKSKKFDEYDFSDVSDDELYRECKKRNII